MNTDIITGKNQVSMKSTIYQSPIRMVIVIALSIFISEMIVMTILVFLQPASSLFEMILDSTLLVLLLLPIFYFLIFRPSIMFITECKQAEEAVKESEKFNRAITQTAVDAIISINSEGNILSWNSAAKNIFGYSSSEMINKKLSTIIPSQHKTSHIAGLNRLKSREAEKLIGKTIEITGMNKNGTEFPIELSLSSWETNNKKYYTGIIRDITERKQADLLQSVVYEISKATQEAKNLDELYKSIHVSLRQVLDVTNFYIAYYDDKEKLLSFPFYKDSKDVFPAAARPLGKGLTEYIIRTGKPLILKRKDIEAYAKKGEIDVVGTLPEMWMGAPLITENRVVGVIAVNSYQDPDLYTKSDIKILTYVAEQVAKTIEYRTLAEKLTESNSMKELLLDVIAHDLKNPAGVIQGFAQFGLENDPKNEILKEISEGADNLLNVIYNATTLSKVTIGDTIEKQELNLVDIINIIINENSSQLQYEEITLDMKLKKELIIKANPIIGEVFRNYIDNAIKYAKNGKKIIIDANKESGYIVVNVKDFGKTIEKKDRENIFLRNVQLDNTKGRGLGLAIAKRIAAAHDAEVGVKPNKPNGNIFYIKIPDM